MKGYMKKQFAYLASLLLAANVACAKVDSGASAPEFSGKDISGRVHKLSDYKGKIVVLESYNYDCPYVARHYDSGAMQELQAWATGKEVVWLLVNSVHRGHKSYRDSSAARQEMERLNIKASAWIDDSDGAMGRAYGMRTTPYMYVIDKEGKLVYQGAIDNRAATSGDPRLARNYVRETVESLLDGKSVSEADTKPYGCGVKYK